MFGPRQDPLSQYAAVILRFILAFLADERPVVYGDGEQSPNLTYIDNAVDANVLAAAAEGLAGRAFNIACGDRISLNALLDELRSATGKAIEATYLPTRPGDVRHSLADVTAARTDLGYEPNVDIMEGLRRTLAWHVESQRNRQLSVG